MDDLSATLTRRLVDAGLIQFGWFAHDGATVPVALHFDRLASYPDLLAQVAQLARLVGGGLNANRLLCPADAIPFGVAYSLRTGIPLVYSKGAGEAPVFDLVGAYDIGHPALMLTSSVGLRNTHAPLLSAARQVGIEIHTLLTILAVRDTPQPDGIKVLPLLRLAEVVRDLGESGRLSSGHVRAVLDWIDRGV